MLNGSIFIGAGADYDFVHTITSALILRMLLFLLYLRWAWRSGGLADGGGSSIRSELRTFSIDLH